MKINQSDLFELLISESTYTDFVDLIKNKPYLLDNKTIKSASVLKIVGRRPLLYHIIIKAMTERDGMTLGDIYRYVKENYGDSLEKKIKAGRGLKNYLEHLKIIGILNSQEKGNRVIWFHSNNNITVDISSTEYMTTQHPDFKDVINSKIDLIIQLNDQSDHEDFDPKRLLQSLIKSDISFEKATEVLYKVIEKIATYNNLSYLFNWDEIPGDDEEKLIDIIKNKFNINWVRDAKLEKIDENRTIKVSFETRSLFLKLNDEGTEVNLEIDDDISDNFIVKSENGKLYIHNRIKKISKNDLVEIITDEMSNTGLDFEPINKFKRLVISTPPYGVYIQDCNDPFYDSLSYEKLDQITLEVINKMLRTENITVNRIKDELMKISSDKNLEQDDKKYWSQKYSEYIKLIDDIGKKYIVENIKARELDPKNRKKAIEKIKRDEKLELDTTKNYFLNKQLSVDRLKKIKFYIIGSNEFDVIVKNTFVILKKIGFKYIDLEFAKAVIGQYIFERDIISREVSNSKEYALQEFYFGREFYELASLYNNKEDIINGSLNALLALNKFYSILFFAFDKIGSSAMFFALTKMRTEIFTDKTVTNKLKELQVYGKYYKTMLYIKNNTMLSTVIQKGGVEDVDFTRPNLDELLIYTYDIMKATEKFIDGRYPNKN